MPLVPLKLPPGVFRPGTMYDAKARWYDASLVRWRDGAMQPVGGWRTFDRADSAVAAALSDDGGAFTNETAHANENSADDVVLVPATPVVGDALYVGYPVQFASMKIQVSTVATDGAVTWEFWNGSAWAALTVVDNTTSFTVTGINTVTFTVPATWAKATVNSVGPLYYVRARVTTAGTTTALGQQIWIVAAPLVVHEPVRGMVTWRANDGTPELAFGTPTKLYQFAVGALQDITPATFTAGGASTVMAVGNYGDGLYGVGIYGTGEDSQETPVEANTWQLDTFGEDLVACAFSDGKILQWDKSGVGVATTVSNAPTSCTGVVVTAERFLVALGASGDGRLVKWADQESLTLWTAATTNQAGDFPLSTDGQIMAGRRGRGETLIWTDADLWTMRYIGGPLVYSFQKVGASCGAISRHSMAVVDGRAIWMGRRGFFGYNGFTEPVPCEVGDYVFGSMNEVQVAKIWTEVRSEFGEVTWYYPSAAANECDRYCTLNYVGGFWTIGKLERVAGVDRGAFSNPIAADASGAIYHHEVGESYNDPSGNALTPYAESGPVEIADGNAVMHVLEIIPDERTLGSVALSLISSLYPTAAETTHGPYSMANPTSVRLTARQLRLKASQVSPGWRLGTPRIEVRPGGRR